MSNSGSSGTLSSFTTSKFYVNSVESTPGNSYVVIGYGNKDVRNVRTLTSIRYNLEQEHVSSQDRNAMRHSIKFVTEKLRDSVTVQNGHDCFRNFTTNCTQCTIEGGDGGLFFIDETVTYSWKGRRMSNVGMVFEYDVVSVEQRGRPEKGHVREQVSGICWLLGSQNISKWSDKLKDPTPIMAVRVGPNGTWVYAWEQGFIYMQGNEYMTSGPGSFCGRFECAGGRIGPATCPLCRKLPTGKYSAIYTISHPSAFLIDIWGEFENFPRSSELSYANQLKGLRKTEEKLSESQANIASKALRFNGIRTPPPHSKALCFYVDYYLTLRILYDTPRGHWVGAPVISPPVSLYLYYLQRLLGIKGITTRC